MTWEITLGIFSIVSAFLAVMKVVVRVNRTLTTLEETVKRLNESIERQSVKNEKIFCQLGSHELRLSRLEDMKLSSAKERSV
jgi:septal ring factor EnvC (AmiA/AmiB activator)